MKDIKFLEKFVQAVFGAFVSVLISTVLTGIYGSLFFNPIVFATTVFLLIVMGYVTWYISDLHLQQPLVKNGFKKNEHIDKDEHIDGKGNSIIAEAVLTFSVGLGAFIAYDKSLLLLVAINWHFAAAIAAGIVMFYFSAFVMLHLVSNDTSQGVHEAKSYDDMKRYINTFIQDLIFKIPSVFIASFLVNGAAVALVSSYWWIFASIIGIGASVLSYIQHVENKEAGFKEQHQDTFLYRLNAESKQLLVRLIVGVSLTLLAGLLLMSSSFILSNQFVVLGFIAFLVFAAEIIILVSKFHEVKSKSSAVAHDKEMSSITDRHCQPSESKDLNAQQYGDSIQKEESCPGHIEEAKESNAAFAKDGEVKEDRNEIDSGLKNLR